MHEPWLVCREWQLGLRSTTWRALGSFLGSANRGAGRMHAFLADGCVPAERRHLSSAAKGADLEDQRVVRLSRTALLEALLGGRFGEAKWTATIALALLSLSSV